MIPFVKHTSKVLSAVLLATIAGACTSTEVIDQLPQPEKKGKTITLSVSAPDAPSTRAGSDHKLRYVAILFEGNLKDNITQLQRKEEIVTGGEKEIVFSVVPGTYSIMLFADYIPSSEVKEDGGLYADYYYDTHNADDLRVFKIKKFEVNNDNMDCFGDCIMVEKTEYEYKDNIVLSRIMSKVSFVSTTELAENQEINNITCSKIPYVSQISFSTNNKISVSDLLNAENQTIAPTLTKKNEYSELFYYYTPAAATSSSNVNTLGPINFTINYKDDTTKQIEIGQGKVKIKRNSIITVRGAFISAPPAEPGDIILDLSTPGDNGWNEENEIPVDVTW